MGTYERSHGSPASPDVDDASSDQLLCRDILNEIERERAYQDGKWGHKADDTKNEPNDWVAYIAHHSSRWFSGGFAPYNTPTVDAFRKQMIKVAALAVAAVESLDRQRITDGAAFYENQTHDDYEEIGPAGR